MFEKFLALAIAVVGLTGTLEAGWRQSLPMEDGPHFADEAGASVVQEIKQLRSKLTGLRIDEESTRSLIKLLEEQLRYWKQQVEPGSPGQFIVLAAIIECTGTLSSERYRLQDIQAEIRELEADLRLLERKLGR